MKQARVSYERKDEADKNPTQTAKYKTPKEKDPHLFKKQTPSAQEVATQPKEIETIQFKGLNFTGRDKLADRETRDKRDSKPKHSHKILPQNSKYFNTQNRDSQSPGGRKIHQDRQPTPSNKKISHYSKQSLSKFYKQEKRKLNIWTFLFGQVNSALAQILKMCEIENKVAFFKGLLDTLGGFTQETEKLLHAKEIENLNQTQKKGPSAWEIRADNRSDSAALQSIHNIDDKRVESRFEDQTNVEFRLLNELVTSGQLDFQDAIVLIIRERAQLMAGSWGIDEVGSRVSESRAFYAKDLLSNFNKLKSKRFESKFYLLEIQWI